VVRFRISSNRSASMVMLPSTAYYNALEALRLRPMEDHIKLDEHQKTVDPETP